MLPGFDKPGSVRVHIGGNHWHAALKSGPQHATLRICALFNGRQLTIQLPKDTVEKQGQSERHPSKMTTGFRPSPKSIAHSRLPNHMVLSWFLIKASMGYIISFSRSRPERDTSHPSCVSGANWLNELCLSKVRPISFPLRLGRSIGLNPGDNATLQNLAVHSSFELFVQLAKASATFILDLFGVPSFKIWEWENFWATEENYRNTWAWRKKPWFCIPTTSFTARTFYRIGSRRPCNIATLSPELWDLFAQRFAQPNVRPETSPYFLFRLRTCVES